jgi:uncharacterized membrane protein YgcG
MRKIPVLLAALALLFWTGAAFARTTDVAVVIDLLQEGVSEKTIRRYVDAKDLTFRISPEDLKALQKAGASERLIDFLLDREEEAAEEEGYAADSGGYSGGFHTHLGFYWGYPYYSPFVYDPYFYYPYYPYYYPRSHVTFYYPRGHRGKVLVPGRTHRGTGVYSYWYRNRLDRSGPGPSISRPQGSSGSGRSFHRSGSPGRGGSPPARGGGRAGGHGRGRGRR